MSSFAALALAILTSSAGEAGELSWSFPLESGVAQIEVFSDGQLVTRFLCADGAQDRQFSWVPDLDDRRGTVKGQIELWLPQGDYTVREVLPDRVNERSYRSDPDGRLIIAKAPEGATSVIAWRESSGEDQQSGFAWAPVHGGSVSFLQVGDGDWRARALGAPQAGLGKIDRHSNMLDFPRERPLQERVAKNSATWMFRALLIPVTSLFLLLGAWVAWRRRRTKGLVSAAVLSAGTGLLLIWPLLLGGIGQVAPMDDIRSTDRKSVV